MKLVTLALIAASTAIATAQSSAKGNPPVDLNVLPGPNAQAGCPVAFTNVSLETHARLMLVKQGTAQDGSLAFEYKNQSGKPIQSISIRVELKVKKSVYDLDATPITLSMTLTGKDSGETLPLNMVAYGLGRVELEQVIYSDDTVWTAGRANTCSYEKTGTSEGIGKAQ